MRGRDHVTADERATSDPAKSTTIEAKNVVFIACTNSPMKSRLKISRTRSLRATA